MKILIQKIVSIILIVTGLVVMGKMGFEQLGVILGSVVAVGGAAMYMMSSSKTYSRSIDDVRTLKEASHIDIKKLYEDFKNINTPLGTPWLSKIKLVSGEAMIFGPGIDDSYVYVYKKGNSINVAQNAFTYFIEPSDEDKHRLTPKKSNPNIDVKEAVCTSMSSMTIKDDVFHAISSYAQTGKATEISQNIDKSSIYSFDEDFNLLSQNFTLEDIDDNVIYDIEGTMPLKTFSIKDHKSGTELFKCSKKTIKILPHYTFYKNGQEYGTFKKKMHLVKDSFLMETADGILSMKSISERDGNNYIIKLDNVVIGSLADRLNFTMHNIMFNHYVIHVLDEKHTLLIAALAIMAIREFSGEASSDALVAHV